MSPSGVVATVERRRLTIEFGDERSIQPPADSMRLPMADVAVTLQRTATHLLADPDATRTGGV
jgi:hypothetical protein